MIESLSFTGLERGPHLLVLGAVHGDEICGPTAMAKIIQTLQRGDVMLARGKVTFVPVANPYAHAVNQRYVDKNLNRIFARHPQPSCEEERIATTLCDMVDDCDYLLDVHSFHTTGVPFVFRDYNDPATVAFAARLGFPYVLSGWPELYGSAEAEGLNMGDTVQYAHTQGKTAVLVECGQHTAPEAIALAESCMWNAMKHLNLLVAEAADLPLQEVKFSKVWVMPEQGGELSRNWQNLDAVKAGEVLAVLTDGEEIKAPADGAVIMPNRNAKVGDEWLYFGEYVAVGGKLAA